MKACSYIAKWSVFVPTIASQTCLNYAECSRKSLVCKMYLIVNKLAKFITTQYIGTCLSVYTKAMP